MIHLRSRAVGGQRERERDTAGGSGIRIGGMAFSSAVVRFVFTMAFSMVILKAVIFERKSMNISPSSP